ncbi:MAG: transketolase C-terminal domain-containing protein [Patescibacteria group bacterium]
MSVPLLHRGWKHRETLKAIATRDGHGIGLREAGRKHKNLYVLCADVTDSMRATEFKNEFPDRFVQVGVSEQAMAGIAAGMALAGAVPVIETFGAFSPARNWEQIRTTIALQNLDVKIFSSHNGTSAGLDGATHQMTEDIALMRTLPNMIVLAPCDAIETEKAVMAAIAHEGPAYVRFERHTTPQFTTETTPFQIGKALVLREGDDVALIGCGPIVYECLQASEMLANEGIEACVINSPSVKPLDETTILRAAKTCGCVVTAENHQVAGGFGGTIAEFLTFLYPVPVERIGFQDVFGQSGSPEALMKHYHLTAEDIAKSALRAIKKKHR